MTFMDTTPAHDAAAATPWAPAGRSPDATARDAAVPHVHDAQVPFACMAWTPGGHPVRLVPIDDIIPHEDIETTTAIALASAIAQAGVVTDPLVLESSSMVLLDGHHRLHALRRLGAERAPCVLIAYGAPGVHLDSWRADVPVDRERVLKAARSSVLLPVKTSRHRFDPEIGGVDIPLAWLCPSPETGDRPCMEDDRT